MQAELWNCQECQQEYNLTERLPKKLSLNSDQTLCLVCLRDLLNKKNPTSSSTVSELSAPDSFPIDEIILAALRNKLNKVPDNCKQHSKPINYVCLKDESIACETCCKDCFRKKHKVKEISKVKKEAGKKREELRSLLEVYETSKKNFSDAANNEKETISTQVEQMFNSFRKKLDLKQKEFQKDIERFFNEGNEGATINHAFEEYDEIQERKIKNHIEILDSEVLDSKFFEALKHRFPNFFVTSRVAHLSSVIALFDDHLEDIEKNFRKHLETIKDFSFEGALKSLEKESGAGINVEEEFSKRVKASPEEFIPNGIRSDGESTTEMKIETPPSEETYDDVKTEAHQIKEYGDVEEIFGEIYSDIERVKSLFDAKMVEDRLVLETKNQTQKKNSKRKGTMEIETELEKGVFYDETKLKSLTKLELNFKKTKNQTEAIEGLDYIWNDFDNLIDLKLIISDKRNTKKILNNLIENDVWATEKIQNFVIELIECEITDDILIKFFKEAIPKMTNVKTLEIELERTTVTDKALQGFVKFCLPKLPRLEQFKLFVDETKIADEGLIELFSGLNKVQKLTGISLGLDYTKITDKSLNAFAKCVAPKFQNLKNFDMSFAWTAIGDEGMNNLCTSLKDKVKEITSFVLDVGESEVTDEGLEVLATQLLPQMQALETLELFINDIDIKDNIIKKIANALNQISSIKDICLELCGIKFTGEGLEAIGKLGLANKPALESLRIFIANTPLVNNEIINFFHTICYVVQSLKTFSLCLSKLPLEDVTLIVFSKVLLERMQNLESFSLQLGGTKITNDGLSLFSSGLSKVCKNMKSFELYIDTTRITDSGLDLMAEKVLPEMNKLESLALYFTHLQVTDVGIGRILSCLPGLSPRLKTLDISLYDTKITNDSLKTISETFSGNGPCALENLKIYLGQNSHISGPGFEKLFIENSFLLKKLKHLTLNIENTKIPQTSLRKFKQFLQENPTNLQELLIDSDSNSKVESLVNQIVEIIS